MIARCLRSRALSRRPSGETALQALSPDYEIRAPILGEISALPAIEVAAAQIVPIEDLPAHMRDESAPLDLLEEAAKDGRLLVAVHRPSSAPVGFALALVVDRNGHLHEMDVHPDHARRGVGAALLEATISWAAAKHFEAITLTTFRHLAWNAPFYARHGFRELPDELQGPELASLCEEESENGLDLRKRLAMRLDLASRPIGISVRAPSQR